MTGTCNKCGVFTELVHRRIRMCKPCHKTWRNGLERRQRRWALKQYSFTGDTPMCFCCGETIEEFLTFDHSQSHSRKDYNEPAGASAMSSIRLVRWLLKTHRAGMRVACYNCNLGRERNGGVCPHERRKQSTQL